MNNLPPDKSALDMSASEFEAAVRNLVRNRSTESNGQSADMTIAKSGAETGTTASTQRAPSPSADTASGDAMNMTSAEWQAALRNLR